MNIMIQDNKYYKNIKSGLGQAQVVQNFNSSPTQIKFGLRKLNPSLTQVMKIFVQTC